MSLSGGENMVGQNLTSLFRGVDFSTMVRPEIGILDLLDILMVAFIVYKIFNWVK